MCASLFPPSPPDLLPLRRLANSSRLPLMLWAAQDEDEDDDDDDDDELVDPLTELKEKCKENKECGSVKSLLAGMAKPTFVLPATARQQLGPHLHLPPGRV